MYLALQKYRVAPELAQKLAIFDDRGDPFSQASRPTDYPYVIASGNTCPLVQ